jgi:beta-lactamase class A
VSTQVHGIHCLFRSLAIAPVGAVVMLLVSAVLPWGPALAPGLKIPHAKTVTLPEAQSLADLYAMRERLQQQLQEEMPAPVLAENPDAVAVPTQAIDQLQALAPIIQREETAHYFWLKAQQAATAAQKLPDHTAVADAQQVYTLWQSAMDFLDAVPETAFLKPQAVAQKQAYLPHLLNATYDYDTARSDFLWRIAEQAGIADRAYITVCNVQWECRRLRGNQVPANPASLIKVPIAVALMEKLHQEKIDPDAAIFVSRGNWTESLGQVRVGSTASLKAVMQDMLGNSSNIATNQLIDYIGWSQINGTLRQRGYSRTRVSTKLVGERTYPANRGHAPNTITTDELTSMMVGIYSHQHPGDELIIEGLQQQYDLALGYAALQPPAIWLGEKTGRNSKVIGSTTALELSGQRYVITVIVDGGGREGAIRAIVAGIVEHLLKHNGFDSEAVFKEAALL